MLKVLVLDIRSENLRCILIFVKIIFMRFHTRKYFCGEGKMNYGSLEKWWQKSSARSLVKTSTRGREMNTGEHEANTNTKRIPVNAYM